MAPRRRSNTGFIGVRLRPAGHFAAEITAGGTRVWLGTFYTKEAAARAYDVAAWRFGRPRHEMNFPKPWIATGAVLAAEEGFSRAGDAYARTSAATSNGAASTELPQVRGGPSSSSLSLPSPRGGSAGSGRLHELAGGASASPSRASKRTGRRANVRGHLRAALFQAPSERARLARSAFDRTPGVCGGNFPPPIRPPPLPARHVRAIAEGGVVAADRKSRRR
ncbi:hypothetical protein QYE76_057288 [Lolium multiflorum]|uniref:AP2/ERF domain-containing protein n=1 Tax=Lolium multiflorum TaxID=4521 RepID=A0AAD8WNN6_LOLMU|nr:hypothetical protein QYE76_057288 [Lolium multiflorum]